LDRGTFPHPGKEEAPAHGQGPPRLRADRRRRVAYLAGAAAGAASALSAAFSAFFSAFFSDFLALCSAFFSAFSVFSAAFSSARAPKTTRAKAARAAAIVRIMRAPSGCGGGPVPPGHRERSKRRAGCSESDKPAG